MKSKFDGYNYDYDVATESFFFDSEVAEEGIVSAVKKFNDWSLKNETEAEQNRRKYEEKHGKPKWKIKQEAIEKAKAEKANAKYMKKHPEVAERQRRYAESSKIKNSIAEDVINRARITPVEDNSPWSLDSLLPFIGKDIKIIVPKLKANLTLNGILKKDLAELHKAWSDAPEVEKDFAKSVSQLWSLFTIEEEGDGFLIWGGSQEENVVMAGVTEIIILILKYKYKHTINRLNLEFSFGDGDEGGIWLVTKRR